MSIAKSLKGFFSTELKSAAQEILAPVDSVFRRVAEAQAGRAFLWFVAFFAAGIVMFFSWHYEPRWWPAPLIVIAGCASVWILRRHAFARTAMALVVALALGHTMAQIRTAVVAAPILDEQIGPFVLSARVADVEKRAEGNHVVVTEFTLPGRGVRGTPEKLRITLPSAHGLPEVGQRISVRVIVRPPALPPVPGGFQFQRALYFQSIGGTGFAVGRWQAESTDAPLTWRTRVHAWTESLRRHIGDRVTRAVSGDHGTVAAALINGEQSAIPQDLQEAYRIAGIAHLLSISGVHMSLLAGIIFLVVRRGLALWPWIALRTDTKKIAAYIGLAATGFYLIVSGASVPAVRSFIMIAIVFAAVLLDRTALSVRSIAWAALILMAFLPDAIVGASFQMSFLAVLSLICLYEQTWLRVQWRTRDGEFRIFHAALIYVASVLVTDIVAGGATSLFAVYHFNRLPTYSFLANAAAVPLTGLWIMPFGVLGLALMPFGLDQVPLMIMGKGVALLDNIARAVSAWPGAQVHVPPMDVAYLAAGAAGAVFVCLWRGRLRWIGLVPVIVAFAVPWMTRGPDLLIDESARVYAITDSEGHVVIRNGRAGRFVKDVWSDRFGVSGQKWPRNGKPDEALGLSCDATGCIVKRNGKKVLIAFTSDAMADECGYVDAMVTIQAKNPLCTQKHITDHFDLDRNGAYAFWIMPDGVRTRSVRDVVGVRAWSRVLNIDALDLQDAPEP